MSGKVFLNTSVIQYLYHLRLLHIIKDLFGKAYIPLEVCEELEKGMEEGIELPDLQKVDYIEVMEVRTPLVIQIIRDLGKGEAAVILLGLENVDSLVVLDDDLARKVAKELMIKTTGTAGVLIIAKEKAIIKAVKPYLDRLEDLGFYLSPDHKSIILKEAGEN